MRFVIVREDVGTSGSFGPRKMRQGRGRCIRSLEPRIDGASTCGGYNLNHLKQAIEHTPKRHGCLRVQPI
jgi:hypothetical protein